MNNNKSFFESFQENLNESKTKCYVLFFDKDGKHCAGSDYTIYSSYNTSNTNSKIMSGDIVHPVDAVSFIILDKSQYDAVTGSNWEKANGLYNKSTKLSTNESIIELVEDDENEIDIKEKEEEKDDDNE